MSIQTHLQRTTNMMSDLRRYALQAIFDEYVVPYVHRHNWEIQWGQGFICRCSDCTDFKLKHGDIFVIDEKGIILDKKCRPYKNLMARLEQVFNTIDTQRFLRQQFSDILFPIMAREHIKGRYAKDMKKAKRRIMLFSKVVVGPGVAGLANKRMPCCQEL